MVKILCKNKLHHFQEFFSAAHEAHVILYVRISVIKLRRHMYLYRASLSVRSGTKEEY